VNGRFKGGHITRHYGDPGAKVHAVQLELSQRAYMDESSREYDSVRAEELRDALRALLGTFLQKGAVQ
jgi:N-formylglutamate deformylase